MSEKKHTILMVDDKPDIVDSLFDTFIEKYKMYKASRISVFFLYLYN